MPYSGVAKEDWGKVDRCVEDVVAKGKSKDKAIPICISAIKGNANLLNVRAATDEDILDLQVQLADSPDILAQASLATNAILKFDGACLARAEINKNGDGITDEGIGQLANTIRLMPITEEHEKQPRGIFTKGYTNEDSTECLLDGFIWAGHFPEFAKEVQDGTRKLSMDAEAGLAVCNICGAAFTNTLEYCEHIRHRTAGAVRWLYDLTAVAGGAVKNPAGTGTVFPGKEGFTVISHRVDPDVPVVPVKRTPKRGGVTKIGGSRMKFVCAECGHEHEFATDAEKIQAELDAKLLELQNAQAELATAQAATDAVQAQLDSEKTTVNRFVELATIAGLEFANEALPSLPSAGDEVFSTFKAMASRLVVKEEPKPPAQPEQVIASEGEPPASADTYTFVGE